MKKIILFCLSLFSTTVLANSFVSTNDSMGGKGIKDLSTGIIWYEQVHMASDFGSTAEGAKLKCHELGLELPTKADFDSARASGLTQLFLNKDGWFKVMALWTSTSEYDGNHTYIASGSTGEVIGTLNTRAVFKSYFFEKGDLIPNGSTGAICISR